MGSLTAKPEVQADYLFLQWAQDLQEPGTRFRSMAIWIEGYPISPRTTKLYDRTGDEITLDEVERIAI